MLTPEGRAKILDFGLAKSGQVSCSTNGTLAARLTTPGLVMGAPGYMAPEQISGKPADARSDIFGLGVILYEMLSGKRAFKGDSTVELINANLKNDPAELPSSVPSPHQRIVDRCLEKNPSRRFQSAADVGFALLAVSDAGMSLPTVTPRRGIWQKWIAAAAAVAILVAAGAYWAGGTRPLPRHSLTFLCCRRTLPPLSLMISPFRRMDNGWLLSLLGSMARQACGFGPWRPVRHSS
jgi:eukaryotic-like serine/threonine-protein kinase